MAYKVVFKKKSLKELQKLDKKHYKRIRSAVDSLANTPRPAGSTKLRGAQALWRLRVGDYRIIYDIQEKKLVILIIRIAHRREAYKN